MTDPRRLAAALFLCAPLAAHAQEGADPFPPSTAIAEGVSPDALAALDALVRGFVDDGEVVGAELHVIVKGRTVLHEAYGWRDRENEVALEPDSVFCVRSMTKPVIGAAIWMLVAEDALDLNDRVAEHLPSFDREGLRDVTVEHLLTHTGGFPYSLLIGHDLDTVGGIRGVAELGATADLDFEPGSGFQYSDQGADTLTALIEVVTGRSAADFVTARILAPLGMTDSTCLMAADSPLRARVGAKYAGQPGEWKPFWSPSDPPLFPFFLGSQGLYSTTSDYARFLSLWLHRGRAGGERLIRPAYVRRALEPGPQPMDGGSGLPGLTANYGHLMQLWTRSPDEDGEAEPEVVAFGHTGSDGTHAWAFPEQRAIVLYFTQSRGTPTGMQVEEALGELFLGVPFDPNQVAPPHADYLGYYRDGPNDTYRAVILDGDQLALEVLGRAVAELVYVGEDRWKLKWEPGTVLAFERDETGAVTGYRIGDHYEYRFEPAADLPGPDAIAARVAAAHRLDRLEELGPMRRRARVAIPAANQEGSTEVVFAWPDRFRSDTQVGESEERVAFDGEHVRVESSQEALTILEGAREASARVEHILAHFGDWSRWYTDWRVIQRVDDDGREVFLVRTGGTAAPASTLYVEGATGLVRRVDRFAVVPGAGRIGQQVEYLDFRDVSGMQLPASFRIGLANPIVDEILVTLEETELGVELPDGFFELR